MTTNHPVPTPPPSEPAPSLRPVEEIERDLALASDSSLRGLSNWPWLSIRLIDDIPALLARLRAAEETLAAVGSLVDAADEASMRPDDPDFEPIDVPWTVAVRAILEVSQ